MAVILSAWLMRDNRMTRPDRATSTAVTPAQEAIGPLDDCWRQATQLLSISAVMPLRTRCDQLLIASDADPLDIALLDWAEFIRRRVPELVAAVAALWATAALAERSSLLGDLVNDLAAIAGEADARIEAKRVSARECLMKLRRHVAGRTGLPA